MPGIILGLTHKLEFDGVKLWRDDYWGWMPKKHFMRTATDGMRHFYLLNNTYAHCSTCLELYHLDDLLVLPSDDYIVGGYYHWCPVCAGKATGMTMLSLRQKALPPGGDHG